MNTRLLVVDADPSVHQLVTDVLKRPDRELETTDDPHEALECLRQAPFDLLLAGRGRNGIDGIGLLRRARVIRPDLKVIVTGESDPSQVLCALRYRAFGYLHKPLPPGPVSEMVQHALEADSWREDIRVISGRAEWITLDIRCKLEAAERTTCFLRELESDLPHQKRDDIVVAFRELLLNAIEHGAKGDLRKHVRVSVVRTSGSVIVNIQDPGPGFSMNLLPHAAISNPDGAPTRHVEVRAEQGQRPGGFGILMTRNLVDELVYNERGNAVMFVKNL